MSHRTRNSGPPKEEEPIAVDNGARGVMSDNVITDKVMEAIAKAIGPQKALFMSIAGGITEAALYQRNSNVVASNYFEAIENASTDPTELMHMEAQFDVFVNMLHAHASVWQSKFWQWNHQRIVDCEKGKPE